MPQAELGEPELERVAALIRERTRLRVADRNRDTLSRLVTRRLAALDLSVDEYLERLRSSTPEAGELEHVTRELTVGETYFFRGTQLEDIRQRLLPEIVKRRRQHQPKSLRILSAGCATGEEPYTLVMMLSEVLPDFDEWLIFVTGLDINTAFLKRAEQALYSDWSLRDVEQDVRERHFVRQGDRYQVLPRLRQKVRFRYVNLALDPLPAPALGVMAMDLILCQNVLFYFEHDVRESVAEKLARCLAPEGFLVFGPADLLGETIPLCDTRMLGDLVVFERTQRLSLMPAGPPSSAPPTPVRFPTPAPLPAVTEAPMDLAPGGPSLEAVVALANDGDLQGALMQLEAVLEQDKERADAHALHGFLLTEVGSLQAALEAFRRSTYLEPELLLAHAGAAMTARRLGQDALAKRASARVRRLVAQQPANAVVEGWEGMTAGRLLRLFDEHAEGLAL